MMMVAAAPVKMARKPRPQLEASGAVFPICAVFFRALFLHLNKNNFLHKTKNGLFGEQ